MNIWTALMACACVFLASCGDSKTPGAQPGEPCQFEKTDLPCGPHASFCYAAGTNSSCEDGGLCLGNGSGMSCAYPCKSDSDCTARSPTSQCLQGCVTRILNGYCVESTTLSELMSMNCTAEDDPGNIGVAGVSH